MWIIVHIMVTVTDISISWTDFFMKNPNLSPMLTECNPIDYILWLKNSFPNLNQSVISCRNLIPDGICALDSCVTDLDLRKVRQPWPCPCDTNMVYRCNVSFSQINMVQAWKIVMLRVTKIKICVHVHKSSTFHDYFTNGLSGIEIYFHIT